MNTKKLLTVALLMVTSLNVMAQLPVRIIGLLNKKRATVKLFKTENGKSIEIASVTPAKGGRFGFLFYPEYEGLYLVGTGTALIPNENYKFYLKGGDQLSLVLNDEDYALEGNENTKENRVLNAWHQLTLPVYQKAINFAGSKSTFMDFFPDLETTYTKSKVFLNGKATGNARFDTQMKDIIKFDLANYAATFLNTPRTAHPSVEEFSPYYADLKAQDLTQNTALVYNYPWGLRTLTAVISVNSRQQNKKYIRGVAGVDMLTSFVANDTIKGDIALENAAGLKTYSEYQNLMASYDKFLLTPAQKLRSENIMAGLTVNKAGADAFNFSYPDKNNKIVTMADLKGKVVLIDVWATWCGPCKAEIPYLKKLEEEMKGSDVAFVSISVDEVKDKQKWLDMIAKEKLGGIQLFASGWNDMSKFYKINAIPRFMVFDKNGKIITIDSPRPSNPELKTLLQKALAN